MCRCLMKPVEEKKEKEERKEEKPVKKVVLKEDMKTIKREEVKTVNSVDPVKREEMKAVNPVNPTQRNKQSKQANTPFPRCKHYGGWGKDLVRSSGFCLHCERLLSQSRSTQAQSRSIPTQSRSTPTQSTQSTQQVLLLFILS